MRSHFKLSHIFLGFSNFSNLKEHKKTHTADKVFTCDECGKSFNMQRKLVKHRIRHTGRDHTAVQHVVRFTVHRLGVS